MDYDVTIVGWCSGSDGMGSHFYAFAQTLASDLKVNCALTVPTRKGHPSPLVNQVLSEPQNVPGKVSVFVDTLWLPYDDFIGYRKMPAESQVKIAYSVFEASSIPVEWVEILNNDFDAVAVPDPFCKEVFKNSGVKRPIFVLPLSLDLHPFLQRLPKKAPQRPFVFGNTLYLSDRKNQLLLAKAFLQSFGNRSDIRLRINSKVYEPDVYAAFYLFLEETGATNIELNCTRLSHESYIDFMESLDCYVSFSKGEGFAIPPREALALGIPCILSDVSAHRTICQEGFARPVAAELSESAWSEMLFRYQGMWATPTLEAAAIALKDVYENYGYYWEKAQKGRQWVQNYLPEQLKKRYLSLVRPEKVLLGERDEVTDEYLITSSARFYNVINNSN